jgi:hypothetical protein
VRCASGGRSCVCLCQLGLLLSWNAFDFALVLGHEGFVSLSGPWLIASSRGGVAGNDWCKTAVQ